MAPTDEIQAFIDARTFITRAASDVRWEVDDRDDTGELVALTLRAEHEFGTETFTINRADLLTESLVERIRQKVEEHNYLRSISVQGLH